MRKQNKIISLILVVAMLMSMLVVVMPAASAASDNSAAEDFVPSATFNLQDVSNGSTTTTANGNLKNAGLASGVDGNMLSGFYGAKAEPFDYYVVNEGDDSYVMFAPKATGTYGTDTQFLFSQSNTKTAITDWYVAEFDVAAEGAFPNSFYVCLPLRDANGSGTATFAPSLQISSYVAADGDWHHVTIVGNLADNEMYVFVDGERFVTDKTLKASNASDLAADHADGLTHTGVKFSNTATLDGTYGETVYLDNVSNRVITGDAITALSAAVTANDITTWTGYTAAKEGSLPAFIEVDGVEYSSAAKANEALAGFAPVEAALLRDSKVAVTVTCDATIAINGCANNLVAGEGVTVTEGDEYVYDAPHKTSVTYLASNSGTNIKNATVADGTTSSISVQGYTSENGAISYIATDAVTGNQYLEIRPGSEWPKVTAHQHINWLTANTTYQAGTYFITEFDIYTESEVMSDAYIGITSRNSAGSNKGGNSSYIKNWTLPVGEWAHVTYVGDVDNNILYIYVNNSLVRKENSGLYNGDGDNAAFVANGGYFQGIRFNINTMSNMTENQNLAIDNVSYKFNLADTWLASNIGTASIANWPANNYNSSYELPAVPAIAIVDGEVVSSLPELNKALHGNDAKNVEILRAVSGTVTVNCDATVNTNGYLVPVAGTDVTVSNNGNVYTFDAPYQKASSTVATQNNSEIIAATTANVAGNLYYAFQNNITTAYGVTSEIITNTLTGDSYLSVTNNDATDDPANSSGNNNSYYEAQAMVQMTPNANTQYVVFDIDASVLSADVTVAFFIVPRGNGTTGIWGADNKNLSATLAGCGYGEFNHLTVVYNLDANTAFYFVNGKLVYEVTSNGYTSAANHAAYWEQGTMVRIDGCRIGGDLKPGGGYLIDNVSIRTVEDAATGYADNSLTAALASKDISKWSGAITAAASEVPPVAMVNGEPVYTAAALNAALATGITNKNVEIVDDIAGTVTVNANATVETNGVNVTLANGTGVTSSTEGTVTTFVAPWKASATEVAVSNGNFIIDSTVSGNLFTGRSGVKLVNNDAGELAIYQVTDNDTGNTYLKLQPTITGNTSANVYLTTEIIPAAGSTADNCVLKDGEGYYVYDLDIATDFDVIKAMALAPSARNNASEGGTFPFPSGFDVANYSFSDGEWMHMTIIGDMAANVQYVYINGVAAGTAGKANAQAGTYEYLNVKGYRMNLPVNAAISTDESILMDNISCRVYKDVAASDGLDAALAAGTLANWSGNIFDGNDALPALVTVNGVRYSSVSEINAILSDGKDNVVSLEKASGANIVASKTATITTNGFKNFITAAPGYAVEDNGDGTYSIVIETRMGSITVKINGNSAIYADVLYGTDIAEYLNLNNTYVFDVISDDNGQVYTGATWDATPAGYVDGDEVYNVTATAFANDILILDATTGAVKNDNAEFKTALGSSSADQTIVILNNDVVLSYNSIVPQGCVTVYMAGHTISTDAGSLGNHVFSVDAYSKDVTFVNGSIVDAVRNITNSMFFCGYNYRYEVKVVNCDLYAVANVATIRGGTFTAESSNIDILEMQNGYGFSLTEYYNAGYTYNKCALNLIDSNVSYRHFTYERTQAMITIKDHTEWGGVTDEYRAAAEAKGYDKVIHEINISGCTVNNSFDAGVLNCTTANVNITIDNTTLNTAKLYNNMKATVKIGDNVLSGAPLTGVEFGKGVVAVNSGNPMAPYAYVNEYATVTWSDGSTELWLDGSIPANAACKTDAVCKVEAGKTYSFEAIDGFALTMKANMTLDANLKFNVYIPTSAGVTGVQIADVVYDVASADVVSVSGVECNKFVYEIAPYYAAASFAIVLTTADYVVAREIDFVEYANLVAEAYADDANAINLVKGILQYVAAAHNYMGVYLDGYDAANKYADADAVAVDTSAAVNTMANVSSYIKSAQLNLSAAPMWRFNVVDGADISGLAITVNGEAVEYVVCDGYVEFELPAYDMCDTITVTVGGATGTYNFAAYYAAQSELASSIDPSTTSWQARDNVEAGLAYYNVPLLDAFYTYAYYAAAYNA